MQIVINKYTFLILRIRKVLKQENIKTLKGKNQIKREDIASINFYYYKKEQKIAKVANFI